MPQRRAELALGAADAERTRTVLCLLSLEQLEAAQETLATAFNRVISLELLRFTGEADGLEAGTVAKGCIDGRKR